MTRPTALVTGGNGGIGAAACRLLAREGAFVWVAGRRVEACEAVVAEIAAGGGAAAALALDVTDPDAITAAVERTRADGPVTWLVNNAGVVETAAVGSPDADEAHVQRHLEVNFHGPRRLTEAFLPGMIDAGGGRVVQVASSAALQGYPYVAAYAASKHALLGWSRAASHDLMRRGVALHVVCPHFVDSPMTRRGAEATAARTGQSAADVQATYAGFNPTGVFVTPDEVAVAVHEGLAGATTGGVVELLGGGERRVVEEGRAI